MEAKRHTILAALIKLVIQLCIIFLVGIRITFLLFLEDTSAFGLGPKKTKPTFESFNCILPAGMLTQPYPWFSPNPWRRHHKLWVQVPTGEFWACREIPRTEHSPLDEIRWSWKNRTQNVTLMELKKKTISVDPFMSVRTTCFVRWIFIVWHFVQWMK